MTKERNCGTPLAWCRRSCSGTWDDYDPCAQTGSELPPPLSAPKPKDHRMDCLWGQKWRPRRECRLGPHAATALRLDLWHEGSPCSSGSCSICHNECTLESISPLPPRFLRASAPCSATARKLNDRSRPLPRRAPQFDVHQQCGIGSRPRLVVEVRLWNRRRRGGCSIRCFWGAYG
jgi:hypothetical protein